ncbi:uncharacterized protein MKK02DRAFT_33537 [Dioszegia hungarica]|uniref:Uncharacterized protein n=1 Tax=Dioszegia hungarica TaxID=4972 RepID=A0AA38LW37_9TREE|nr:uncharacterized protein MKK02DRAFT_33537 [Dioszegia hungarica]KAI9636314.1 hypothetical protein MKK02DRAFT_33537 [Dioszegia hungarica]
MSSTSSTELLPDALSGTVERGDLAYNGRIVYHATGLQEDCTITASRKFPLHKAQALPLRLHSTENLDQMLKDLHYKYHANSGWSPRQHARWMTFTLIQCSKLQDRLTQATRGQGRAYFPPSRSLDDADTTAKTFAEHVAGLEKLPNATLRKMIRIEKRDLDSILDELYIRRLECSTRPRASEKNPDGQAGPWRSLSEERSTPDSAPKNWRP